jgi:hypothetical protein
MNVKVDADISNIRPGTKYGKRKRIFNIGVNTRKKELVKDINKDKTALFFWIYENIDYIYNKKVLTFKTKF